MTDIKMYQTNIDIIDLNILDLLEKRMIYSKKIGEIKLKKKKLIYDLNREKKIIDTIQEKTTLKKNLIKDIWDIIFKYSRDIQISLKYN